MKKMSILLICVGIIIGAMIGCIIFMQNNATGNANKVIKNIQLIEPNILNKDGVLYYGGTLNTNICFKNGQSIICSDKLYTPEDNLSYLEEFQDPQYVMQKNKNKAYVNNDCRCAAEINGEIFVYGNCGASTNPLCEVRSCAQGECCVHINMDD